MHLKNIQDNEEFQIKTEEKKCIVVYFIGGVTYGEIAAIRWIAKKYSIIFKKEKNI